MRGLKNIRLPEYDYRIDGYYFVTIVSNWRQPIFKGKEDSVINELNSTIGSIPGVRIDTSIVMPNHVHVILVLQDCKVHLSEIIRRFKAKVSYALGTKAWQPNYYEHIIGDERALDRIREYITLNPELEMLKFEQFYK